MSELPRIYAGASVSLLICLFIILLAEFSQYAYVTIPAILVASLSGLYAYTRLSSRGVSDAYAVQIACATAALLSGLLRTAFEDGKPSFSVDEILFLLSPYFALLFILPAAVAVLAGGFFENNASLSKRRVLTLCVVIAIWAIVNVSWSMGLWENPLTLLTPCICMYASGVVLAKMLPDLTRT